MNSSPSLGKIMVGNLAMMACCVFYLIWWYFAFNPNKDYAFALKAVLLVLTIVPGVFGLVQLCMGVKGLRTGAEGIKSSTIILAGIGVYIVMLLATYFIAHRQVTTELALIIGWTVLELCVTNAVYNAGIMDRLNALTLVFILAAVSIVALVCYLAYYDLGKMAAFYDGMVPLILCAVVMLYQTVILGKSS